MNKKIAGIAALIIAGGLTGCNGDKGAMDRNYGNDARPIGYNTNEGDNGLDMNRDMIDQDAAYDADYDGRLAERIQKKVNDMNNVDDAHVILDDNNVIVGIDTSERDKKAMDRKVEEKIQAMVPGRDVQVTTDDSIFGRIENVDNDLRDGMDYTEVEGDVKGIMSDIGRAGSDLGNAIKRPFENNR
ncbi:YhcN/YlaJ family sporulation lipoprotein [Fictibacillus iocasae]|uniref:YhcN/YlaJ family sporulation lipoprotein n=1 Tax=Fictibacillus iocasae TaxID=2715437 RepID=A0ABW2NKN3_9BACL